MNLLEAISARHSVRAYKEQPLEKDVVEVLEEKITELNRVGQLHMQLIKNDPQAFLGTLAKYGKFRGVQNYIVMAGKKAADLDDRIGYYGEALVLLAQTLGLNTCWVGLSYKKIPGTYVLEEGETIQAYISTASSMQGEVGRQFAQIRTAALSGLNSGGGGSGTGGGIPKPRAAGGPVYSGKTYLVGEEGPELIRMSGNGTVVPNEETNKLLSTVGSSGNTYKNDISVSFQIGGDAGPGVMDQLRMYGQEFADRVLAVVAEAQEDNMRRSFAT